MWENGQKGARKDLGVCVCACVGVLGVGDKMIGVSLFLLQLQKYGSIKGAHTWAQILMHSC